MSEPKLGKEKLYTVHFKDDKSHPFVAESPEAVKEMILKDGEYTLEDIKEIVFQQSYYAWDYKQTGVYGPPAEDWNLD
ncbi:MAG: hypothetical protein GY765_35385 [bacterium]|nr:hypothetical protein [bacterium]